MLLGENFELIDLEITPGTNFLLGESLPWLLASNLPICQSVNRAKHAYS